jgi:hypothetical protein
MQWISLVTSLPTENATARMRAWRTLKASGAAVLRDGVYLLPATDSCAGLFSTVATDILDAGGTALVLDVQPQSGTRFEPLFDRTPDFAALLADIAQVRAALVQDTLASGPTEALRQTRKLRKSFTSLVEIDFCAGEAQLQAASALLELEKAVAHAISPNEPQPTVGDIARRSAVQYQNRVWATRARPWVDRLASAWLIRRFIDPQAQWLWLESPQDCPSGAVGFDFDGAEFSHVGARVTFEVLLVSFGLIEPALQRLGGLVHFLDAGGVQPPEAAGIESVLAGMRSGIQDDDALLAAACAVLDGVYQSFRSGNQHA